MKKSILAIALLLCSVAGAMAQEVENPVGKFSLIPHVGVGIYNWSKNELSSEDGNTMKSKNQAGFTGGVDVEYRATQTIGISLGVNYARQGFKFSSYQVEGKENGNTVLEGYNNIHANLDYIQVPLLVKAYITPNLSVMAGVQAGFLCGDGKLKMDYAKTVIDKEDNIKETESHTLKTDWPTKKVNVSIPVGLSYEYMGVILNARYNIGLVNVAKTVDIKDAQGETSVASNSKNSGFEFAVGYRFTL